MRTPHNLLWSCLLLLVAGCGTQIFPSEFNLDGNKPKPPVVVPDKPVKPDTPAPAPSKLPDGDVSQAVADVFTSSTDPRAKFDVVDYYGLFQALSEVVAADKSITTKKQFFDAVTQTRLGLGLDTGRYPAFSKVVGDYTTRKIPAGLTDEADRHTAVEVLQVIAQGCNLAHAKLK